MLDEKDEKILEILQRDGRTTNVELARLVELTPSATLERVRKLEERGFIKGYSADLDPHALGLGLLAFIFVRADDDEDVFEGAEGTAEGLAALPSVQEVHHLAGEDCFLVKVRARDTDDLYRVLKEEFGRFKAIRSTRTTIVLKTVRESQSLPVRRDRG
jgi:Lrp/AsnC family leucine-responsive transcriptional regulator